MQPQTSHVAEFDLELLSLCLHLSQITGVHHHTLLLTYIFKRLLQMVFRCYLN